MSETPELPLLEKDILTRVTKYNLIRSERMLYIDVHEAVAGTLAGQFVAVPNLINIVAKQAFQGVGETEKAALKDCLEKIQDVPFEAIFPQKKTP